MTRFSFIRVSQEIRVISHLQSTSVWNSWWRSLTLLRTRNWERTRDFSCYSYVTRRSRNSGTLKWCQCTSVRYPGIHLWWIFIAQEHWPGSQEFITQAVMLLQQSIEHMPFIYTWNTYFVMHWSMSILFLNYL